MEQAFGVRPIKAVLGLDLICIFEDEAQVRNLVPDQKLLMNIEEDYKMAKSKEVKTNAMRILDRMKIPYTFQTYECEEFVDGQHAADLLGLQHEIVFKTLVTEDGAHNYFVFAIPIDAELDLKKAAKAAGCKSLSMIHVKDIQSVTGYIRGGCTAIGMKKSYPVFMDASALHYEKIAVSGGKIGLQLMLTPRDYEKAARASFCDLTRAAADHDGEPRMQNRAEVRCAAFVQCHKVPAKSADSL